MPDTPYEKRRLFRLIHIDNLECILKEGLFAPSAKFNPTYVNIGDETLIAQRTEFSVPISPGGLLSDYVPFYFGGCSPMLLNIKTGYRGVTQREQSELIYLCAHIDSVISVCPEFCFTDGHAKDKLTTYFNQISALDQIDWSVVSDKYWTSTEEDPDRMRKKQAEFLVKKHVPVECFAGIIVHDEIAYISVEEIMKRVGISLPIHIDYKHNYYYND